MSFTNEEADAFVQHHIDVWNSHSLNDILDLYAADVELVSPLAANVVGSDVVRGREELSTYFSTALERHPELRFEVVDVLRGLNTVTIYMRSIGGALVCDVLFIESGKIRKVLAHYSTSDS